MRQWAPCGLAPGQPASSQWWRWASRLLLGLAYWLLQVKRKLMSAGKLCKCFLKDDFMHLTFCLCCWPLHSFHRARNHSGALPRSDAQENTPRSPSTAAFSPSSFLCALAAPILYPLRDSNFAAASLHLSTGWSQKFPGIWKLLGIWNPAICWPLTSSPINKYWVEMEKGNGRFLLWFRLQIIFFCW